MAAAQHPTFPLASARDHSLANQSRPDQVKGQARRNRNKSTLAVTKMDVICAARRTLARVRVTGLVIIKCLRHLILLDSRNIICRTVGSAAFGKRDY
jgi:hypothetical protein